MIRPIAINVHEAWALRKESSEYAWDYEDWDYEDWDYEYWDYGVPAPPGRRHGCAERGGLLLILPARTPPSNTGLS
jgi:hypothetical protein